MTSRVNGAMFRGISLESYGGQAMISGEEVGVEGQNLVMDDRGGEVPIALVISKTSNSVSYPTNEGGGVEEPSISLHLDSLFQISTSKIQLHA